jgi:formylglycine-generating enzyme required for sulfatase activity
MAVSRATTATWVLPTTDEWYKAAYYSGGGTDSSYWLYPTQSNNAPSNVLSSTGDNNANYTATINTPPYFSETDPSYLLTSVGSFVDSPGPYGTFDQGGDVYQWTEGIVDDGLQRGIVGGDWAGDLGTLQSYEQSGGGPPAESGDSLGFRVAYVPEPRAWMLLLAGMATFVSLNFRRSLCKARNWR